MRKTPQSLALGQHSLCYAETFQGEKEPGESMLSRPGSVILKQWAGAALLKGACPASWDSRAHLHKKVGYLGLSV